MTNSTNHTPQSQEEKKDISTLVRSFLERTPGYPLGEKWIADPAIKLPFIVHPRVIKEEMNISEYPICLMCNRIPENINTIEYKDWISAQGNKKRLKWTVTGSDEFRLPLAGDQDVYAAIMELWREKGFKDRVVPIGTIYKMLKRMGWSTSNHNYKRFKLAIKRLAGLEITAENAFWDKENRRYIPKKTFRLFSDYHLVNKDEGDDPTPFNYIVVDEFFHQSIKNGNVKSVDLNFYYKLSSPLAKRLYRFLDKKRYNKNAFSMELLKLVKKAGLMPGKTHYGPAKIKALLNRALDECVKYGFLKSYTYGKTIFRKNKITFIFPQQVFKKEDTLEEKRRDVVIGDILKVTQADHSTLFYRKAMRLLGDKAESYIYHALSLTKEADHLSEIRTTRDQYFISTLIRLAGRILNKIIKRNRAGPDPP